MSLDFMDSFQKYETSFSPDIGAQMVQKGWNSASNAFADTTAANVRTQTVALKLSNGGYATYYYDHTDTTIIVCTGLKFKDATAEVREVARFEYNDGFTNNLQCTLVTTLQNGLALFRGDSVTGTLLAQATANIITPGSYQDYQIKFAAHDSLGSIAVKLNNTLVSFDVSSGLDTNNGHGNICNQYTCHCTRGGTVTSSDRHLDSAYFMDTTGSKLNDFLGVEALVYRGYPDADSAVGYTPSSGGDNYEDVDDNTGHDDDDTYVSASTSVEDRYTQTGLPTLIDTVYAAQYVAIWRLEEGGADTLKLIGEYGSTYKSAAKTATTAYGTATDIDEEQPDGSEWTSVAAKGLIIGTENVP